MNHPPPPPFFIWHIISPYVFAFIRIWLDLLTWDPSFVWLAFWVLLIQCVYKSNFQNPCGSYCAVTWTTFIYLINPSSISKSFMPDLCNHENLGIKLYNCHFRSITRGNLEASIIKTLKPNISALRDLNKDNTLFTSLSLNGSAWYQWTIRQALSF